MKIAILILFLFIWQINLIAQDTLVFADGRIRPVQITNVDTANYIVLYIQNNKSKSVSFNALMCWKSENKWSKISRETGNLIYLDKSPYKLSQHIFAKKNNSAIGKYGLSFGYESGFYLEDYGNDAQLEAYNRLFAYNPTISIKPFFAVTEKLTFELPFYYGISTIKEPATIYNIADEYGNIPNVQFAFDEFSTEDADTSTNPALIKRINLDKQVHRPELLFQVGLNTKFYPYRHSQLAFYIGQGFHFGYGNYFQADYLYKYRLDTEILSSYNKYDWVPLSEEIKITKSSFSYFRYESSIGVDLNLSKYIGLNLEFVISNSMKNNGMPDRVYTQVDNGPVVLKYEGQYMREPYKEFPNIYPYSLTGFRSLQYDLSTNIRFALILKLGELKKKTK